jgi:CubicO group peptidase (beta-lactamase class C family)
MPSFSGRLPLATFVVLLCATLTFCSAAKPHSIPVPAEIEAYVRACLEETKANGLALAVVDEGRVTYVRAFGIKNAAKEPLTMHTVMYGASLTKTVVAYLALKLVDAGRIDLDRPIAEYLERPLPEYSREAKYADWSALKDDPRWRRITPRICLTHSTGFANFGFLEPDGKLRIHFDPGTAYAYSGDGFILLQLAIEKGLKIDLGDFANETFKELGMARTSLMWRREFANDLADGWDDQGKPEAHDERSKVRAAGSMDTTIDDMAKFAQALVNGSGLSPQSRAEMSKPQLHIKTAHQFPTFQPALPPDKQRADLYAGLGVVVFQGPQGRGFFKGGHNNVTANTLVCLEDRKRAVVILANDVRAEAAFEQIVRFLLGETGVPFDWEYGQNAGKS